MNLQQRTALYGVFEDIRSHTSFLLAEYEQISEDLNIRERFPFAAAAYLQSIIVNLGKIFGHSDKNEPYRLARFKKLQYPSVTAKIEKIETEFKTSIEKIRNNRNNIFAHTGLNFHEMRYSPEHVARLERLYGTKYPQLVANDTAMERYTAPDLANDIPKIRELLESLQGVWQEALASDPEI